jgi:hypothetical protein
VSELRQTRFIINGIYILEGTLPNDEIWIVENQILLKQTGDDEFYNIRNDIVHGITEETPTLNHTTKLLGNATKSLQCCYILSGNRKDQGEKHFKRKLLKEIDHALLDHDKRNKINEEI